MANEGPDGREPTLDEKRAALEKVAQSAAQAAGPIFEALGAGFVVLGFEFGDPAEGVDKWSTYVSNAQREGIIHALRECADTLERRQDIEAVDPAVPSLD